jgi:primase-polymerase (primpol)-like protein
MTALSSQSDTRATFQYVPGWKERVPEELRRLPQWVLWRHERRGGKRTKPPYRALAPGVLASTDDPATWATFDLAVRALEESGGQFEGVGFVFSEADAYVGIDLDEALNTDGRPKEWAAAILGPFLPTYAEVSPSGRGVKLWVRGALPEHGTRRNGFGDDGRGAVEMYDRRRFFTVTGNIFGNETEGAT